MNVAVLGAAGFTGGELLRLLLEHPEVTSLTAASRSQAGRPWGDLHPGVAGLTDARFTPLDPGRLARGCDVVFLALEHGASSHIAREVLSAGPKLVVDLAADFRVQDASLYREYYGEHADPALLARFTYALADVEGEALEGRDALAVPGCFATAAALALRPASGAGSAPVLFAITGSSGAGTQPKESTHHPRRASNVQAYAVLGHRHEAEIVERWRAWEGREAARPRLITHQGPFVRGIYLTLHARGKFDLEGSELLARAYGGRRFVRVVDEPPALAHVVGTNTALVHAAVSDRGDEIQIHVAIDNLVKGAAGQAIQAMNLALGFAEDAGLRLSGVFPC